MKYKSNEKITVAIDLTSPVAQHQHGMATIVQNLLLGASKIQHDIQFIAFCTEKNRNLYSMYESSCVSIIYQDPEKWVKSGGKIDILHHPFNNIFKKVDGPINIVTVCDLIPLKHPDLYPGAKIDQIKDTYHGADHILTISESAKVDIINFLGLPESKITHCPISTDFALDAASDSPDKSQPVLGDYLVFPATFRPHKNHTRLLAALAQTPNEIRIALSTGEAHASGRLTELQNLINTYNLQDRVISIGNLSREDYYKLIKHSSGLIFPSIAEGFGLPVLEGGLAQRNISCSWISPLVEITNGEADYFDPYSTESIALAIKNLWHKRHLQKPLPSLSQISQTYSIESQTKEYLHFYKQLIVSRRSKYTSPEPRNGETITASANILFHSGFFDQAHDLYKLVCNIYSGTPLGRLINHENHWNLLQEASKRNKKNPEKMFAVLMDVTRLFTGNPYSGISKYVENTLIKLLDDESVFLIPLYNPKARGFKGDRETTGNLSHQCLNGDKMTIMNIEDAIMHAMHLDIPVVYFSSFHPLPENRVPNWNYCITIFDVIHLTEPKYYPQGADPKKYITSDIINSVKPSDTILPISRYTLNDTLSCLKFTPKSSITYLAPGIVENAAHPTDKNVDILIPFQNDPRKGFPRMVKIVREFIESHKPKSNLNIAFFGRQNIEQQPDFIELKGLYPDFVSAIIAPSEDELTNLYCRSKCFLYLSEAEGFGMPPLEAMACGAAPIVLANTALAEVFSGWAYMLQETASDTEIIDAIDKVMKTEKLADSAINFSKRFSWETTKNLHLAAFLKTFQQ